MTHVALLTLHGMGSTLKDYADGFQRQLRSRLGLDWEDVAAESVFYQGILQPNQRLVWHRMLGGPSLRHEHERAAQLFGFADAIGLEFRRELAGSAYEQAQVQIAKALLSARDRMAGEHPVVFVTESLGCQVLSNYLYDAQRPASEVTAGIWRDIARHADAIAGHPLDAAELAFLRGDTVRGWITVSCNIPAYVAADVRMRIRPIRRPHAEFRWLNLYDPDDAIGWPLRPLGQGYELLVEDRPISLTLPSALSDSSVSSALSVLSDRADPASLQPRRGNCWSSPAVIEPVARMLGSLLHPGSALWSES